MRRQDLQPDWIYSGDVSHVDVLGVDNLGVHHVRRMLHCVQNTLGMHLQRNVAPDGAVGAGVVKVGRVGEKTHHYRLQNEFLLMTRSYGDLESL